MSVEELRNKVIKAEIEYALSNPPDRDELRALYRAYYKEWSEEELEEVWAVIQEHRRQDKPSLVESIAKRLPGMRGS